VPDQQSPSTRTLSEADSKALLGAYGLPFPGEVTVTDAAAAGDAARELGFPVVAKLCGDAIAHKTERGLVRLGLGDADAVRSAATDLLAAALPDDGEVSVLLAPMISGARELIAGVSVDPQFGPTVMVGIGGVLAEAIDDAAVRLAPLERIDAMEMIADLTTTDLLGAWRGEPAVDLEALADILMALSAVVAERPDIVSIDLNPLIVTNGQPIAVDALVELMA